MRSANIKKIRTGLLFKMAGISSGFVFAAILILAILSVRSVESTSLDTALIMGTNKIMGDLSSFEYIIASGYGHLSIQGGELVDAQGNSIRHDFRIVDRIARDLGVQATIFMRQNNDLLRVTTSIADNAGRRVVDTFLGADHAAFSTVMAGNKFTGMAVILGRDYLTAYQPLFAPNSREVIGALFLGIEMESIETLIISARNAKIRNLSFIAVLILLASTAAIIMVCRISLIKPIREVMDGLKSLGEGDMTRELSVRSNDEVGDMVDFINVTRKNISGLIKNIKKGTDSLSKLGQELASDMTETAAAMNEITANIQSIKGRMINQSASVAETNSTMEQMTANIQKLNNHIERQSVNVTQSSSAIEEMLANIKSVTQTLIKNNDNVNDLTSSAELGRKSLHEVTQDIQEIAKESEGLLEINSVMNNIASQTNLLSMNAAIEAAHAGESGKGFAVVADEIRKLAENSSKQSKTISSVLKKMKSSIDKIIMSTGNVTQKFEAINSGIKIVAEQEENIRNAMEEQGQGSKQILEAISQVNEITQLVKSSSMEMLEGAREVINEANNLQRTTEETTGGMNEMSVGTEQVNKAVLNVNELTEKNKEEIQALVKDVLRFKVD